MIARALTGVTLSAVGSVAAWHARALSDSGAVAAWGVGTAVVVGTSWRGAAVLGTFFVSSSVLTRGLAHDRAGSRDAHHQRNARQVLANGAVAGIAALVALSVCPNRGFTALAGSLSAATADTWATEVGSTSPSPPRLLLSRRTTDPGVSGGVTSRGILATFAGAALIGACTLLTANQSRVRTAVAVAIAGVAGSLLDSALGELLQERRYCPNCRRATEEKVHNCGARTILVGGVQGVSNDIVNLAATLVGASLADFLSQGTV